MQTKMEDKEAFVLLLSPSPLYDFITDFNLISSFFNAKAFMFPTQFRLDQFPTGTTFLQGNVSNIKDQKVKASCCRNDFEMVCTCF